MHDAVGGADGDGGDVPETQLPSSSNTTTVMSALLLPVRRFASPAIRGGAGTAGAIARGRRGKRLPSHNRAIATRVFQEIKAEISIRKLAVGGPVVPSDPC